MTDRQPDRDRVGDQYLHRRRLKMSVAAEGRDDSRGTPQTPYQLVRPQPDWVPKQSSKPPVSRAARRPSGARQGAARRPGRHRALPLAGCFGTVALNGRINRILRFPFRGSYPLKSPISMIFSVTAERELKPHVQPRRARRPGQ